MTDPTSVLGNLLWTPDGSPTEMESYASFVKAEKGFDWAGDYHRLWQWSVQEKGVFWSSLWDWHDVIGDKGTRLLINEDQMPGASFFPDASINYAQNMLAEADDRPAIIAYGEDGRCTRLTRAELKTTVMALAGWMQSKGIRRGDRVAAYLPNGEHALIAMLATAAIGGIFSSCSPDFGLTGVSDRFGQITPRLLIAADGYQYNGKVINRLDNIAELAQAIPSIETVVVVGYINPKPDISQITSAVLFEQTLTCDPLAQFVPVSFNDPLYILYSSGTTGAPKCIVHSVGGTLMKHICELRLHSNVKSGDNVFYFTTCGWMMWNWLVSALLCRATVIVYEGNPFYPEPERLWQIAESEKFTLFGTSAKYIDAVRKAGLIPCEKFDLSTLRTLCSTGSPLSAEGFQFVYEAIHPNLQLASISGGTDIMGCFVLGCPVLPVYAGEIQVRGLGMDVAILNEDGQKISCKQGELCCLSPFVSMPVGFWNDDDGQKYKAAYFTHFKDVWRHGDWATLTEKGGVIIHGRSDATLNPGGVRIGTAEIYRIVEAFDDVIEALVIGQTIADDVRVILFVRLADDRTLDDELQAEIKADLRIKASPRHVPAVICAVPDIPRTRSGKISELAVRDIVHGRDVKNTEALANPDALVHFRDRPELAG